MRKKHQTCYHANLNPFYKHKIRIFFQLDTISNHLSKIHETFFPISMSLFVEYCGWEWLQAAATYSEKRKK